MHPTEPWHIDIPQALPAEEVDTEDWPNEWECACGEMTSVTHWRHGADGVMFHAGAKAPPSDPSPYADARANGCAPLGPD